MHVQSTNAWVGFKLISEILSAPKCLVNIFPKSYRFAEFKSNLLTFTWQPHSLCATNLNFVMSS